MIHAMNLAALDLNLLVALDALVGEAHVGRAARRIGLSQPATSHALRRLRELVGDPLLVRTGARMELTPRAEALRAPLAEALDRVRGLFAARSFEPATSARRFALVMSDHLVELIIPPLLERFAALAPHVRLDVTPWRGTAMMTADLARSIDLVLACTADGLDGFHRRRLFSDSDALAVRIGHDAGAGLSRLSGFRAARHVAVIPRGHGEDPIDSWLRPQGIERSVALVVPSYLQALHIAARTDLVAFVPRRLIASVAAKLGLRIIRPPLDPGSDQQFMFHPARMHDDPGSIWLRANVVESCKDDGVSEPLRGSRRRRGVPDQPPRSAR
jgi:DNA-binding transcriptional LysR family regulator